MLTARRVSVWYERSNYLRNLPLAPDATPATSETSCKDAAILMTAVPATMYPGGSNPPRRSSGLKTGVLRQPYCGIGRLIWEGSEELS